MTEAAQNLSNTQPRNYGLYDDLLTPVVVVSPEFTVVYFNQTFAQFVGLPPRKIRSKPIDEVIVSEQHKASNSVRDCLGTGAAVVTPEIAVAAGSEKKEVVLKFFAQDNGLGGKDVVTTIQDFSLERILHSKHRIQLDELKAKNAEIQKYSEGLEILVEERTKELRVAMDQSERLLLNILPRKVADRLKANEGTIADRFDCVSVLFVDIVSFTPLSSGMDPVNVVDFLGQMFDAFDSLMDRYQVEKIKTIGDCYLAVAGVPEVDPQHAINICAVALAMRDEMDRINASLPFELKARFGIHSGPVVAGVIGQRKFAYDIWGDTVNVASRMESHGQKDRIQISAATYELVKDHFVCEERGMIDVKGKGSFHAYWLNAKK